MESIYGLKILPPFNDNFEFDVDVGPESEALVVYKTTPEGHIKHHYKHTSWCYLYPECEDDMLKNLMITRATKVLKRKLNDKEIDIFVYVYSFSGGFSFYYLNKTKYTYRERLGIDLINLIGFDNSDQTYFEITLLPNEDYILEFKVLDLTQPFSYKTHVKYKLYQPDQNNIMNINNGQDPNTMARLDQQQNTNQMAGGNQYMPKHVQQMLQQQIQTYGNNDMAQPYSYPVQKQENQ